MIGGRSELSVCAGGTLGGDGADLGRLLGLGALCDGVPRCVAEDALSLRAGLRLRVDWTDDGLTAVPNESELTVGAIVDRSTGGKGGGGGIPGCRSTGGRGRAVAFGGNIGFVKGSCVGKYALNLLFVKSG